MRELEHEGSVPYYILVAGYVAKTEALEDAVVRERKEEAGMTADQIQLMKSVWLILLRSALLTRCEKDIFIL